MSHHDDPFANDDLASWVSDVVEDSWDDGDDGPDLDPSLDADLSAADHGVPPGSADDVTGDDGDDLGGIELAEGDDSDSSDGFDDGADSFDDVEDQDDGIPSITLGDPDDGQADAGPRALDVSAILGLAADLQDAIPDPAVVAEVLERLDLGEGFLGVAGRGAALVLQELGVDAHVAHGSVEELADRLESGSRVSISGPDGTRIPVVDVDFGRQELVVADADGERRVELGPFVEAWSSASFEMVVAGDDVVLPFAIGDGGS